MKAMGKGSVSSFLTVLLGAGWYVVALGLGLVSCLLPFINVPGMKLLRAGRLSMKSSRWTV